MGDIILLAMHGVPPKDYPPPDLAELFALHMRLQHAAGPERAALERRYAELDARIRPWPRTPENDPFHAASQDLARAMEQATGSPVVVGFNEFCGPSLDEALEVAVARASGDAGGKVIVVTPMMTRGGEHAEVDIPEAIRRAHERHPETPIVYAWPYNVAVVARFLADQAARLASPAAEIATKTLE